MWPLAAPWQVGIRTVDGDVKVGDVVGFLSDRPGRVVVHRVIDRDGDRVWTRGDTNLQADPPWPRTALLGRVVALRRGKLTINVPEHWVAQGIIRQLGRAWARIAPPLRQVWVRGRRWPRG